jgi:hypothetical protein
MLTVTRGVGDAPYRKQCYSTARGGLQQETTPPPAVLSGSRSARRRQSTSASPPAARGFRRARGVKPYSSMHEGFSSPT